MPHGQVVSSFKKRVKWLVKHKKLWSNWYPLVDKHDYFIPFDAPIDIYAARHKLFRSMQAAKLFSPTTYWLDVKLRNELVAAYKIVRSK